MKYNIFACFVFSSTSIALAEQPPLRVFPMNRMVEEYDPINAKFIDDVEVILRQHSPLLELGRNGEVEGVLAKSWKIIDDTLQFELREGLKTIDGHAITADDAVFSIRRLIFLGKGGGTHTELADRLCGKLLDKFEDNCPGLKVTGRLSFQLRPNGNAAGLIRDFTRADLVILPQKSVDSKTLKIVDFRNTSGPYYFEKRENDGTSVFVVNKSWPLYSPQMPQKLHVLPKSAWEGNDSDVFLYRKNKLDYVSTSNFRVDQINLAKEDSSAQLFEAQVKIISHGTFTIPARKRLSADRRRAIQAAFQRAANANANPETRRDAAHTFYLPMGWGALTKSQEDEYNKLISTPSPEQGEGIVINLMDTGPGRQIIEKAFPKAKITQYGQKNKDIILGNAHTDVDIVISNQDHGISQDDADFVYDAKSQTFPISDITSFLAKHLQKSVPERRQAVTDWHYAALVTDPTVLPFFIFPQFIVLRKPWSVESRYWVRRLYRFRYEGN